MMTRFKLYILLVILALIQTASAQSKAIDKVGTTSFQFLKVMPDARATGMGDAYTTVVNTSEAVFWNPAALSRIERLDASLSYLDYFMDAVHQSFSFAYRLSNIGTFGFQGIAVNMGEFKETRVEDLYRDPVTGKYNPGLTGNTFEPGAFVIGLSFSRSLTDKFMFGITGKYIREDLHKETASAYAFDTGILYRTGYRSLELSAVLRHFGPEVKYVSQSYPQPQTLTVGIAGYLVSPDQTLWLSSPVHSLVIAYDLSQTRDHAQQQHIGLEYGFNRYLFVRTGYKLNYDEEGFTFGTGLNYSDFRVDYSYCDYGEYLDTVHRFTFGYILK